MTPHGAVVRDTGTPHVHLGDGSMRRPLRRRERFALYGALGWAMEVAFTGVDGVLRGRADARLEGHSYLWMLPIYGSAAVALPLLRDRVRERPAWARAAVYATGIVAAEYLSGHALRRLTGVCPWDYGSGRLVVQGVTRLDYLPLWAVAGLALERLDDLLRSAPVVPFRDGAAA